MLFEAYIVRAAKTFIYFFMYLSGVVVEALDVNLKQLYDKDKAITKGGIKK